jgi:hypothetical protein
MQSNVAFPFMLLAFLLNVAVIRALQNVTYGNDTFVLLRRDSTHADYGLLVNYTFSNASDTFLEPGNFSAYFLTADVVQGNLLVGISGVLIGASTSERLLAANYTLRPLAIVETDAGGNVGSIITVYDHVQGWYPIGTGTLQLPENYRTRLNVTADSNNGTANVTVATLKYISNSTNSQNLNTTVLVTCLYLPSIQNQTQVGMGVQMQVQNFPFRFNDSSLTLTNELRTLVNCTNCTQLNASNSGNIVTYLAVNGTGSFDVGPSNYTKVFIADQAGKRINQRQLLETNGTASAKVSNVVGQPSSFLIAEAFAVNRTQLQQGLFSAAPSPLQSNSQAKQAHRLPWLLLPLLLMM